MAKKVAGISIPIDAETREFKKEMTSVNKDLKLSESYARNLNKALELDPTNIKTTEKAIENMSEAIKQSEKKTEMLNQEFERLSKTDVPEQELKKLENQITASTNKTQQLNKEMDKLQTNLKYIESGEIDKLSQSMESAKKDAQQLSNEMEGLGDINEELTGILDDVTGGLLENTGAAAGLMKALGPLGVAIAGVASSFLVMIKNSRESATVMREYSAVLVDTEISTEDATTATKIFADTMGMEVAEAAEIGKGALKLYGDQIKTTEDMIAGMTAAYGVLLSDTLSIEEAQTILNAAQSEFNLTLEESTHLLFNSIELFQTYGKEADDIADTFREWADTFVALGFTADEFFTMLERGLILGAKNTDEVANAFNEMFIIISEGSDDTAAALETIGLNLSDMQTLINEGMAAEAFVEIVNGISQLEDSTQQMLIAGQLFGTMGEEWIAVLAADTEKVNALNEAMAVMTKRTETVNKLIGEDFNATLSANAEQLGLTSIQANDLAYKLETMGWGALTASEKMIVLQNSMITNAAAGKISEEQMLNVMEQLELLTSGTATMSEKLAIMNKLFLFFNGLGVLTTEQVTILTDIFKTFTGEGLVPSSEAVQTLADNLLTQLEIMGYSEAAIIRYIEKNTELTDVTLDNVAAQMSLKDILNVLTNTTLLSSEANDQLESSVAILNDEYATAADKITAATDTLKILNDASLISDETYATLSASLEKYSTFLATGSTAQDDLTQSLLDTGNESATTSSKVDDFTSSLKESVKFTDELQGELEKAKDDMKDFGKEADQATEEMKELNKQIDRFNASGGTAAIDSSSSSGKSVPSAQTFTPYIPNYGNNVAQSVNQTSNANNSVSTSNNSIKNTFNITLNVSGSEAAGDLEELADKLVDRIDEKLGGLYY